MVERSRERGIEQARRRVVLDQPQPGKKVHGLLRIHDHLRVQRCHIGTCAGKPGARNVAIGTGAFCPGIGISSVWAGSLRVQSRAFFRRCRKSLICARLASTALALATTKLCAGINFGRGQHARPLALLLGDIGLPGRDHIH